MVPGKGLEPPHLAALAPETSASTNFATRAFRHNPATAGSTLFSEDCKLKRFCGIKKNTAAAKQYMLQLSTCANFLSLSASILLLKATFRNHFFAL